MDNPIPQGAEEPTRPKDLRAELFRDLSTLFSATLESDGSIPTAAQQALVELIDGEGPTATQIVAAASKSDPQEEEPPSE